MDNNEKNKNEQSKNEQSKNEQSKKGKDVGVDAVDRIDPSKNVCRKIANKLHEWIDFKSLGYTEYFTLIHNTFIFLISFISLFNNNILHLTILLVIISLDATSIVLLHECPLTTMEKKYLGITSCEVRREHIDSLGIMYNCDHEYEKQIELLINGWMLVAGKLLIILCLNTINIKLINYNNLYT
jgi:hypothetical protein